MICAGWKNGLDGSVARVLTHSRASRTTGRFCVLVPAGLARLHLSIRSTPLLGLYAAVTRQTLNGEPSGGWFPEQRITIEEAIRAYTYNTAYANFEEKTKGSIEVHKVADLVVLTKNLLQASPREILDAKVVMTIVDGKI